MKRPDKKRKRQVFPTNGKSSHDRHNSSGGSGSTTTGCPSIEDPYRLCMKPCTLDDHRRKKTKKGGFSTLRNCASNPNCLYGLGEYQKGFWNGPKAFVKVLGPDPRANLRVQQRLETHLLGNTAQFTSQQDNEDKEHVANKPCGLRNLGATCYLNSMLQTLFVNCQFRQAVFDWEPKHDANAEHTRPMRALQQLFAYMQLGNRAAYDPTDFAKALGLNNVVQQDAQEFSKLLLTHLGKIFSESATPNQADLVEQLFQGTMSYVTQCLRCRHKSRRASLYTELSLNIKGHKSVEECLLSYLGAELLDGENRYLCDACTTKQNAERFIELDPTDFPQVLTLQLMRFVFDPEVLFKKKLSDAIEINLRLNMSEILMCTGTCDSNLEEARDITYRLVGYLNHRGKSAHVGHYTACVAYPDETRRDVFKWYEFDDEVVTPCHHPVEREAAKRGSSLSSSPSSSSLKQEDVLRSRDAYMLLYVREDCLDTCKVMPPPALIEEIADHNSLLLQEAQEYLIKLQQLEQIVKERQDAYVRFFERGLPFARASSHDFYWVDTNWLRAWITGEVETFKSKTLASSSEQQTDGGESSPIAVDSDPESKQSKDDESQTTPEDQGTNSTGEVDDLTMMPSPERDLVDTRTDLADKYPFNSPMNTSALCCPHATDTKFCFGPEIIGQLKRISKELYEFLRDSVDITSDAPSRVFTSRDFRCEICEDAYVVQHVNRSELALDLEKELTLLKEATTATNLEQTNSFLISRKWFNAYKQFIQKQLRQAQRNRDSSTVPPSQTQTTLCRAFLDAEDSEQVLQTRLNDDICCAHGKLTLNRKKYRPIPLEIWSLLISKFPHYVEFSDPNKVCKICQQREERHEEALELERAKRDAILSHGPIHQVFARKNSHVLLCNRTLEEVFPADEPQFLVSRGWLDGWRQQMQNVDAQSAPLKPLESSQFFCQHGKLLIPRSLSRFLNGLSVQPEEVDVELLTWKEVASMARMYSDDNMVLYFGIADRKGRLSWKSCESKLTQNASLWTKKPPNTREALGQWFEHEEVCSACAIQQEKEYLDSISNFKEKIVYVRLLHEDQAVPTEATVNTLENSSCRRSKRIRAGTNTTWKVTTNADDTVYMLKNRIFESADIMPLNQKLYHAGNVLMDSSTLKESRVKAGDSIFMRTTNEYSEENMVDLTNMEKEVGFVDSVFFQRRSPRQPHGSPRWTDPGCAAAAATGSGDDSDATPLASGPSAISSTISSQRHSSLEWNCVACTFLNSRDSIECEVCSSERPIELE